MFVSSYPFFRTGIVPSAGMAKLLVLLLLRNGPNGFNYNLPPTPHRIRSSTMVDIYAPHNRSRHSIPENDGCASLVLFTCDSAQHSEIEHFFNINSDSFYNHRSHLLSTSALRPISTRLSQSMLVMCSLEQLLAGKFRRVVCITGTSRDSVESCGQDRKGPFGKCNPTNSHHRCNNNTLVRCTSDGKWARAPRWREPCSRPRL